MMSKRITLFDSMWSHEKNEQEIRNKEIHQEEIHQEEMRELLKKTGVQYYKSVLRCTVKMAWVYGLL